MNKHEIRVHLDRLGQGAQKPEYLIAGICWALRGPEVSQEEYEHIRKLMVKHPKASKNYIFPIAHPTKSPERSYMDLSNLWEPEAQDNADDAEYVRRRLRLCRWLATQLKKEGW